MSKGAKGTELNLTGRPMLRRLGEEVETAEKRKPGPLSPHYPRAR